MRTQLTHVRANSIRPLLAASLVLAISFTLSCSSDNDDGDKSSDSGTGVSSSSSVVSGGPSSSGGNSSSSVGGGGPSISSSSSEESSSSVSSSSGAPDIDVSSSSFSYVGKGNDIANYETEEIGSQVWMAENLNYAVEGSKCYDNDPANCDKYGMLYDWATAMDLDASCNSSSCASQIQAKHRGICPEGWHIPDNAEWDALYRYADGTNGTDSPYGSPTAGTKLKSAEGWNPSGGVPVGTDELGFSALPGGLGNSGGNFGNVGDYGYWWSATEYNSYYAYDRLMGYSLEDAGWNYFNKDGLFSVRCLQD